MAPAARRHAAVSANYGRGSGGSGANAAQVDFNSILEAIFSQSGQTGSQQHAAAAAPPAGPTWAGSDPSRQTC